MRCLSILCSVLFMAVSLSAEPLVGVVVDGQTNELLVGATVYLKENPSIGTTTGLDGSFVLPDVPSDACVVCSYIGYCSKELPVDKMGSSCNVALEPASMSLGELSVVAKADRSTEQNARHLEKVAPTVLNVMSARSIEVSPDMNVAGVLQRMSGVTMEKDGSGDGQYAILRGMDKRYNYTLVNGVKIPSPDNKNRYVALDMFPSELLDRLEVHKALTADMEGDATGGVVNMEMKDAPEHFVLNAHLASGFSTMTLSEGITLYERKGLMDNAPRILYGSDYVASMADFTMSTSTLNHRNTLPDMTAGLSIGHRFLHNKFGIMAAASFHNYYKVTDGFFFSDVMPQSEQTVRLSSMKNRTYFEQLMEYGAHLKLDYRISSRHDISWYGAFVGTDSWQLRDTEETDLSLNYNPQKGNATIYYETRSRYTEQHIFNSTLQGKHEWLEGFSTDWSVVYSLAGQDRPDNTYITLENNRQNNVDYITADYSERRWERNDDRDWTAYLNVKYGTNIAENHFLELKVGGLYRNKVRHNNYVSYNFLPSGVSRPVMGQDFNSLNEIEWRVSTPKGSVGPLNYDAGENIGAAYLMGTYTYDQIRLIAGIRAEHTDQHYYVYYPKAGDSPNGGQIYWDFLPSVHMKYSPIKDMNIRADYFRSINRPGFFEIVPYSIIYEDYMEFGNKDLKRAEIDNVDIRWEWFPRVTEQIMVGLFYKHIKNPIEYAYYTVNNRQFGYGPANLGTAQNVGVEVDLTKYFRNFGIKANYTYTHSEITTPKTLYEYDSEGNLHRTEKNQTRPLVGQAPHVANLALLYKDTKYGWDAQLAGAYTSEKIAIASHYYNSDYWDGDYFSLDASVSKSFKCGLVIFFKGSNLLNTKYVRYIKTVNSYNAEFPYQNADSGKTLIKENRSGQSFLFGLRFKM